MPRKAPSYRARKGYSQALVTLTDADTGQRRDYWLGEANTPHSRELYHRLIAEWEANGRRLPASPSDFRSDMASLIPGAIPGAGALPGAGAGVTVAEVLAGYWRYAAETYGESQVGNVAQLVRLVRSLFGSTPAIAFGPKRLRLVREAMVRGDATATPPRKPWSRPGVNRQVQRLCAIFKWAAGQEMIPISVFHQLKAVEPLRRGRTEAHDPEPVGPVAQEMVDAIKSFVSRQVWALIELQRLTGARGGELFTLRRRDLQTNGEVWTFSPATHKNAHRGKSRTLYFGPKAQAALAPFLLNRAPDAYLFSPAEAEADRYALLHQQRQTPLSCGHLPGDNRADAPERYPGDHYTPASYHRAIQRACDAAFPPPETLARQRVPARGRKQHADRWESATEWKKRLGPERWAELKAWRKNHRWHPHQLRHAAATNLRRQFGLEAAQLVLGHSSALVTDAVYAERDEARVVDVMRKIG